MSRSNSSGLTNTIMDVPILSDVVIEDKAKKNKL